jgi:hypothetical protein
MEVQAGRRTAGGDSSALPKARPVRIPSPGRPRSAASPPVLAPGIPGEAHSAFPGPNPHSGPRARLQGGCARGGRGHGEGLKLQVGTKGETRPLSKGHWEAGPDTWTRVGGWGQGWAAGRLRIPRPHGHLLLAPAPREEEGRRRPVRQRGLLVPAWASGSGAAADPGGLERGRRRPAWPGLPSSRLARGDRHRPSRRRRAKWRRSGRRARRRRAREPRHATPPRPPDPETAPANRPLVLGAVPCGLLTPGPAACSGLPTTTGKGGRKEGRGEAAAISCRSPP